MTAEEMLEKYSGKWYLTGYADVYIEVSQFNSTNSSVMRIKSCNFSLPFSEYPPYGTIASPYMVYPNKAREGYNVVWGKEIDIMLDGNWTQSLEENKIVLGDNCVVINNENVFVREKGSKDRYYDTPYRAALGVWYLKNRPSTILEVSVKSPAADLESSDTFEATLTYPGGGGCWCTSPLFADDIRSWDTSLDDRYLEKLESRLYIENDALVWQSGEKKEYYYREKTTQAVTGIVLDATELFMWSGETKKLTASLVPADATERLRNWKSSDDRVATVDDNGKVTARAEGVAIITAISGDGGYTATCKVTVKTKLKIALRIDEWEALRHLYAWAYLGGGSKDYVEYHTRIYYNGKIVAETAKKDKENKMTCIYTPLENGEYTVEAYVKDSDGHEATCTDSITISWV